MIAHGHYNDGRSGAKGIEPEGIEVGVFDGTEYIFGAIERGSGISLHAVGEEGPVFVGYLPLIGDSEPEGLKAMPELGLLAAADEELGKIVFYAADLPSTYPSIQRSTPADISGPIGWGALSGFVDATGSMLYAVPDSAYQSSVYVLDVASEPADVVDETPVTDPDALLPDYLRSDEGRALLDLEGVATADDGLWLVSEGETRPDNNVRPNLLVRVNSNGVIQEVIELPFPKQEVALVDEDGNPTGEVREISENANRFGFEGVTVAGDKVLIAFQRTWGDDPPGIARIGEYDPSTGAWAFYGYELDASANNPGLSEIVALGAENFAVIERDGANGSVDPPDIFKTVKTFSIADATPTPNPTGEVVDLAPESMVTPAAEFIDLVGSTPGDDLEKWECLALKDGTLFVANDNDGAGESRLLRIEDFGADGE